MTIRPGLLLSWLFALALVSGPSLALRCGTGIVSVGDSTLKLLKTCGEPTLKEHFEEPLPGATYDPWTGAWYPQYGSIGYDIWTYNFGPNRFIQRITIRNGEVYRIESQGYGY
jgi:hypothetical protein